jgi:hypothetical protein
MQRVEDRLCAELAHEHAVVHAAVAADEPAAEAAAESGADDSDPEDAPVEPKQDKAGHRTHRRLRPCPSTLPSYEQARAIEALLLLKNAAPDEPPTPRAGAP